MIKFFTHIKFWLPFVLIAVLALVLELVLRKGWWDSMIEPRSYLGNAVYRVKALREFGLEKIDWITVGDSRTDWGIEHNKIFEVQDNNGITHLRMSFESSNFLAIQETIDWSMAHMPNLKGILIGLAEENLAHLNDVTKQFNVAWPFRDYMDEEHYTYFIGKKARLKWIFQNAVVVYFKDLRNFIKENPKRLKSIRNYRKHKYKNIFMFNRNVPTNVCALSLDSLQQCTKQAAILKEKTTRLNGAEKFVKLVCGSDYSKYRAKNTIGMPFIDPQIQKANQQNWRYLFEKILDKGIELYVVVLPEHHLFDYAVKPKGAESLMNDLIKQFSPRDHFTVLDLRDELKKTNKECHYFTDPLHYNNKGKKLITHRIIGRLAPDLKKQQNNSQTPKVDKITRLTFEQEL